MTSVRPSGVEKAMVEGILAEGRGLRVKNILLIIKVS